MFLTRILIGLFVCALGFFMVWKTNAIVEMLGPLEWFDRNFGLGGTRMAYKLLGTIIILIGFLIITNLFDIVIGGFIGSIF